MCRVSAITLVLSVSLPATLSAGEPERRDQYSAGDIRVPAAYADEPTAELSIARAAAHLDAGAIGWSRQRNCVTCHTNGTYLFIRPALSQSLGSPDEEIRCFFESQLASLRDMDRTKLKGGTRPAQLIYIAAGLAEWDAHISKELSVECDQALRLVFEIQNDDGSWKSLDCWPPFESSAYQEATMAAMAVAAAPGWLNTLADDDLVAKIDLLKNYVRETAPPHDYGRVLQLWSSLRLDGILDTSQQKDIVTMITEKQRDDGGWSLRTFASPEEWGKGNRAKKLRAESQFSAPLSDGHMTGLALVVLQEAGLGSNDVTMSRGLDWLRNNQRESGRWWTQSLNTDNWHFITYSGTAYPLLALQRAAAE